MSHDHTGPAGPDWTEHEDALRRALEAEAARVGVRPDALGEIRARIRRTGWRSGWRSRWTSWGAALGGGVVAAVAGGAAVAVLVAGPAQRPPDAAPISPPAAGTPSPPSSPRATTAPPGPPPATADPSRAAPATSATLAVYYLGTDWRTAEDGTPADRPRLYREFARLAVATSGGSGAARTRAAVAAMLARPPADPDYASAWPAGATVRGVSVEGGTVAVDLSGAGAAVATDLGAERARVAVQQLVWTATAASGLPAVRLTLDGRPADLLFGHVPAAGPLRRAALGDVVAPVWLIAPQHGATLRRDGDGKVGVHLAGQVFEATASLRVRQGGRTVAQRTVTLDAGAPAQGEARLALALPPGTYVFEAYAASAVDGSVQHLDDHTVTVR